MSSGTACLTTCGLGCRYSTLRVLLAADQAAVASLRGIQNKTHEMLATKAYVPAPIQKVRAVGRGAAQVPLPKRRRLLAAVPLAVNAAAPMSDAPIH